MPGRQGRGPRLLACAPLLLCVAAIVNTEEDELRDISYDICWHGDYTKERCCQGDETTTPDCWDGMYTFGECCPNADCWEGAIFTHEQCCGAEHGPGGNKACWEGIFSHEHCCMAGAEAQSWVDTMVGRVETDQFYAMDEFYTDAQYGDDFGYYSTGHVLRAQPSKLGLAETQQFAHFTTYPMALSPHFARVFCRLLFVMWIQLEERAPFRVVEMGAGSGQLAFDIQQCVKMNDLGIAPSVWRRWAAAFEYVIMERSPALAKRQRERGLRVVAGDAQTVGSCQPVLQGLAQSAACSQGAVKGSPECVAGERGTAEGGASVVISNELLDAFAPMKLRLSLYGIVNATDCLKWQEVRLVHAIPEADMHAITDALGHSRAFTDKLFKDLHQYTESVFCGMANSSIGIEARERVPPGTSCLALVLGLGDLLNHVDLGVPMASHNMRMRIRKDNKLWERLREVVIQREAELRQSVVLPRDIYRQLRSQLKLAPDIEVMFLHSCQTYMIPVTITQDRCDELMWWFKAHESRIDRLARFYRGLGYPAVHLVVRPGEMNFINLVDCLLGPTGGFKLSIDYGANFEALGHSLSIDPRNDGIFVPPIPHELMQGLPECHNYWPKCAGRIDWTTFVDFTNLAAAGEMLGWKTLFYGPQSALEHTSGYNMSSGGREYFVPGYALHGNTWTSRHVRSWYGREEVITDKPGEGGWVQRWTSFKALLLEKPPRTGSKNPRPVVFPSWHLDTAETDPCWKFDFTTVPLSDWIPRQKAPSVRKALEGLTDSINNALGREYSLGYEEAQLAVRMVDWLVATMGCHRLQQPFVSTLLESKGLWRSLKNRLNFAWKDMWGEEAVARIAEGILRRIAEPPTGVVEGAPTSCLGHHTYKFLCEAPGGGSMMPWGPDGRADEDRRR